MKKMAVGLMLVAGVAQADMGIGYIDGNQLFSRMTGDHMEQMYALGYVAGVSDTGQGVTLCSPANVTVGQIRDMVKQHLTSYPGDRHIQADHIVIHVLKESWPCAKKSRT